MLCTHSIFFEILGNLSFSVQRLIRFSLKTTPVLIIEKVTLVDENNNHMIDVAENCYFQLVVKNNGKTVANKALVETQLINQNMVELNFERTTSSGQIQPGQSLIIKVAITGNQKLQSGMETFEFAVSDSGKYKSKPFIQKFGTKKQADILISEWNYPLDLNTEVKESKININLCIKTNQPLIKVSMYVNNTLQQIQRSFKPISDNNCSYTIKKELNLKSGKNEIKLEISTNSKMIFSETRIVSYKAELTEYRNALVIGNSNYLSSPLENPVNDAKAMAEALRNLNFDVIEVIDGDKKTMRDSVREFKRRMKQDKGVGLFYYAGHGVQLKGENYLIPVNHDIQEEYDIQDEAIRVNSVLSYMHDAGTRMNIIILDACRDNPFARSMRSSSRGLASVTADGSGSIIAYATAPGSTAADGDGDNGLYTQELLKAIKTPGLEIGMVFRHVLANVQKISHGNQIPWTNSSITGKFYFSE